MKVEFYYSGKQAPGPQFPCDNAKALELCKQRGLRAIDHQPRRGIRGSLVAFLHPAGTGGVLTELVQPDG